jgi:hypothetical protein
MEQRAERLYAYGISIDPGPFECVDCGQRYEHMARAQLPPCPSYRDSTHTRAAWRYRPEATRGSEEH